MVLVLLHTFKMLNGLLYAIVYPLVCTFNPPTTPPVIVNSLLTIGYYGQGFSALANPNSPLKGGCHNFQYVNREFSWHWD